MNTEVYIPRPQAVTTIQLTAVDATAIVAALAPSVDYTVT